MTSNEILKADLLDIVFDKRNKQYGAYTLRKNYNSRLSISLMIALSTILLFFLFKNGSGINYNKAIDNGEVEIKEVTFPKTQPAVIHLPKMPALPRMPRSVIPPDLSHIIIKPNVETPTYFPDIRTLENVPISTSTGVGNPNGSSLGNSNADVRETKTSSDGGNFKPVEKAPEFPGGMEAWKRFLSKYLIVPDAMEPGEKKTVLIRFQVSSDGSVKGFEVVNSAGAEYDNEVIRVLKKMPKWNPAMQNGHAITVSFMQPVTFVGPEQ